MKQVLQLWAEFSNEVDAGRNRHGNISISYAVRQRAVASRIPVRHKHGTCINAGETGQVDYPVAGRIVRHKGSREGMTCPSPASLAVAVMVTRVVIKCRRRG